MRRMMVVFCCLTILPFASAGGDPGVDTGPEIEGTSIAESTLKLQMKVTCGKLP